VVELKTAGEIAAMRAAGRVVADALAAVRQHAAVGVRLTSLDQVARQVLADSGAQSPFLGYLPRFASTPFPAVICTSVNDAVLHGIPGRYQLRDGDLLSVDCGAVLDGWTADAAISFPVGGPRPQDQRLIEMTEAALAAGITAAVAGSRIFFFGGHGVGRTMHEAPSVPNEGQAGRGMRLVPGLVIAIEPWFLAGGRDDYLVDRDGWTLRSADGSRGAHAEHTIAVTAEGPAILTVASA